MSLFQIRQARVVDIYAQLRLVRLPGAFGIQQKPFDPSTYNSEEELNELKEKKRLERAGALIRWRWKQDSRGEIVRPSLSRYLQIRDAKGKPMRESNARIVKWSDGSYQLLIGNDNVIDLQLQDNKENTQYVTVIEVINWNEGRGLPIECQKRGNRKYLQNDDGEKPSFLPCCICT